MYAGMRINITALIILYSFNLLGIPKSKVLYQILQKLQWIKHACAHLIPQKSLTLEWREGGGMRTCILTESLGDMNAYYTLRCTALELSLAPALSPTHQCAKPHWDSRKASSFDVSHWRGKLKTPEVSFELAAHLLGTGQLQRRPLGPLCRLQSRRQNLDPGPTLAKPSPNPLLTQVVSERTTPAEWPSQSRISVSVLTQSIRVDVVGVANSGQVSCSLTCVPSFVTNTPCRCGWVAECLWATVSPYVKEGG